jgi:hypothetical protein
VAAEHIEDLALEAQRVVEKNVFLADQRIAGGQGVGKSALVEVLSTGAKNCFL